MLSRNLADKIEYKLKIGDFLFFNCCLETGLVERNHSPDFDITK